MLKALADSLLTLAYPQTCRLCNDSVEDHSNGVSCSDCWNDTRIFDGTEWLCYKCGAYLGEAAKADETFCPNCRDHYYDIARAVGVYEKALAASVVCLKKEPYIPARLRSQFVAALQSPLFGQASVIMPVPLSRKRFHERGFNQAELLAATAANAKGVALDKASLVRNIHTPMHRAAMDPKAREKTVENAFEVARLRLVDGESILLVDDVLTSGSTASACAKVLKQSGALWVGVLTLARAV